MAELSLRELECFTAVAEERSFTAAARRLHLSQPPLSRHIAALEARLGVRLFERNKRAVRLTEAGEVFWAETRGVLPQLARAEAALRTGPWKEASRLEIGFVSALGSPDLLGTLNQFRRLHPEVRVTLHDETPSAQMEAIRSGRLDLGFLGLAPPRANKTVAVHAWRRERVGVFLAATHRLAASAAIPIRELAGEPMVFVSGEAAPAFVSRLHQLFTEAGLTARVVQESSRAQAVALMAVGGSAVALLPESVAAGQTGFRSIPLLDGAGEEVFLDLVIGSAAQPSPAARAFLACAGPEGLVDF